MLLSEYKKHPNLQSLFAEGYSVIIFFKSCQELISPSTIRSIKEKNFLTMLFNFLMLIQKKLNNKISVAKSNDKLVEALTTAKEGVK